MILYVRDTSDFICSRHYLTPLTPLSPAQLEVRTNTNIEIVGHPGGSTLDAQTLSRIFNLDWRAALTLKNVTLINGRAADGGAIKLRSRTLPGASSSEDLPAGHYARLAILGGAIRNCEATINGGAIAAVAESALFGSAVGRGSPLVAASSASAPAGLLVLVVCAQVAMFCAPRQFASFHRHSYRHHVPRR